MGVKLTLRTILGQFLSAAGFNANNSDTITAFDKALDRTDTVDNAMEVQLDMALNKIINVPDGVDPKDSVNLAQTEALASAGAQGAATALGVTYDNSGSTLVATNVKAALDELDSQPNVYATVAALVASTSVSLGDFVSIKSYTATNNSGVMVGEVVAASTGTADGGQFIDLTGSTLQFKQTFDSNSVDPRKWGAPNDGVGDDTAAFIAAARFLLSKTDPGGTILVDGRFKVTAGSINFWDILATAQGITPAADFLPNGDLVRGTYIALQGFGYERSRISVIGAGDGFTWGHFTSVSVKRAMSGHAEGIDFRGDGVIGHTSQVIISGVQGFTTTTNPTVGTTNTTTRCLVFAETVPNTFVTNCRFRHFQEAVHQTFGFGFVIDKSDIQFCNIGCFFDTGVTTWTVGDGMEIEVSAVGIFSKQTSNGHIGAAVIEANTAGCDVLVFISKFLSLDGTWFEGSLQNMVVRGDLTAPSLPNSGWTVNSVVGLNIDNNGGMVNFYAQDCAMNLLGESFAVNIGEKFENIVYENCTSSESDFDVSSITISGIATLDSIKVKGRHSDGILADFPVRDSLIKKGVTSSASNVTPENTFTLEIDNETTTARIEIRGYWKTAPANDVQMQTFKYVGVIDRAVGVGTIVSYLADESFVTKYPATGTNIQNLPAVPVVTITGSAGATQEVTAEFALGTSVSATAATIWEVEIFNETDGIRFK